MDRTAGASYGVRSPKEVTTTAFSDQGQVENYQGSDGPSFTGIQASPAEALPAETPDGPLQEDQYGHFHGGASEFAFLHTAKQKLARLPSISIHFSDYPLSDSEYAPTVLPPRPIAEKIMRTFFDFGLTTSRFVHEPSLMGTFEELYADEETGRISDDLLSLVYMVMALGSHYSRASNRYCGFSARSVSATAPP